MTEVEDVAIGAQATDDIGARRGSDGVALGAGGHFAVVAADPDAGLLAPDIGPPGALGNGANDGAFFGDGLLMGGLRWLQPIIPVLIAPRHHLYAGGSFTTAGGKVSTNIAKARIASAAESITASGSSAAIQFSGVVGYEYHVQRTDSLTSPMTWTTLTTTPLWPAADGSLTFTDTNAPPGTAYYRLVQH